MRLVFLKSSKIANQPGYFFKEGRWHSIKENQTAPKHAPVSKHPEAAGQFEPVKHFTDEQWEMLKLPDTNVNAKVVNKKIDELKHYSETGNVSAILGMSIGSNNYGKQIAIIANKLLEMHGSEHKVEPGQKPGTHAAVAMSALADESKVDKPVDKPVEPVKTEKQPEPVKAEEKPKKQVKPEPAVGKAPDLPPDLPPDSKPAKSEAPTAGGSSLSEMIDKIEMDKDKLPESNSNAKTHNAAIDKIKAMALAGDLAGLQAFYAKKSVMKQNYALKQAKLAAVAIAAVEESKPTDAEQPKEPTKEQIKQKAKLAVDAEPVADASAEPSAPILAKGSAMDKVVKNIKSTIGTKNIKKLAGLIQTTASFTSPNGELVHNYAKNVMMFLAGSKTADEPAKPKPKANVPAAVKNSAIFKKLEHIDPTDKQAAGDTATDFILDYDGDDNEAAKLAVASLKHFGFNAEAKEISDIFFGESEGPQEGDTRQGADGMLMLKNGHWVKVGGDEPKSEYKFTKSDDGLGGCPSLTISLPDKDIYIAYVAESKTYECGVVDSEALSGEPETEHFDKMAQAFKWLSNQTMRSEIPLPDYDQISSLNPGVLSKPMYDEINQMHKNKEKFYVPGGAPEPTKPTEAKTDGDTVSIAGWEKVGGQLGSNVGGKYKDADGVEWYCKFPADENVAKSEVLASKLYAAAGIAGQDAMLVSDGGKVGIASKWQTVTKGTAAQLAASKTAIAGFATDAWLANWDVVGLGLDNLQFDTKGNAIRVDAGGSLKYRAQGGTKQFGDLVAEIDSMRDAAVNPQAAAVFGKMTDADLNASVAKVLKISDEKIMDLVTMYGPGTPEEQTAMITTLLNRKADLAKKFPKAAKKVKVHLDPSALPVSAEALPKRHDFNNWTGANSPLSSQPHVNDANKQVEKEMWDVAMAGDLTKLKDFKFQAISKETGKHIGAPIPIADHPSKHVQQYHSDLVQALDEIANPPEPLKVFKDSDVSSLAALTAAFKPKKFGTTVEAVKANEKLGYWVALGVAHNAVKSLIPHKVSNFSQKAIDAAFDKYKEASSLAKHFVKSVQASGSYNDLFRDGKKTDHAGNKLTDVAKAALAFATEQPEGTSVYRWQQMSDDMVAKMMKTQDGTVFQATGQMCTSYSPSATSGFGKHRITVRYAKGAKAVESFGSGKFSGEKEVTTLPNARFLILSKKMVPDNLKGGKDRLELEVLMLPPDLGL